MAEAAPILQDRGMKAPELCTKVEFSESLDPLDLPPPFKEASQFLKGEVQPTWPKQKLQWLCKLLRWPRGGNAQELYRRVMEYKAIFDLAGTPKIEEYSIPALDELIDTIKASRLSHKTQKLHTLRGFRSKTLHQLRSNAANAIQMNAIREALIARRPVARITAYEWRILESMERFGYELENITYVFKKEVSECFEYNGNMISLETLERLIEETKRDLEGSDKAIAGWEDRVRLYSGPCPYPFSDTPSSFKDEAAWQEFANNKRPISVREVERSKQEKAERECRLNNLLAIKAAGPKPAALPTFQPQLL